MLKGIAMRYFVLIERAGQLPWGVVFGDYDREEVVAEMREYKDRAKLCLNPKPRYRVIAINDDSQSAINAAVAQLNSKD